MNVDLRQLVLHELSNLTSTNPVWSEGVGEGIFPMLQIRALTQFYLAQGHTVSVLCGLQFWVLCLQSHVLKMLYHTG